LELMISLCPGRHAKVERTKMVLSEMTPLLLELWREQHPEGHEQVMLAFNVRGPAAQAVPLEFDDPQGEKNCEAWRAHVPELIDVSERERTADRDGRLI
jgi:hypothetical protein